MGKKFAIFILALSFAALSGSAQNMALKGCTILTITKGVIENGTIVIQSGRITAVGQNVEIPAGVKVLDISGKYVMPGIIDTHVHYALTGMADVNEATNPVTPQIWMKEALVPEAVRTLSNGYMKLMPDRQRRFK